MSDSEWSLTSTGAAAGKLALLPCWVAYGPRSSPVVAAPLHSVSPEYQSTGPVLTPEVPFTVSNGPVDWYSGETLCNGAATTGEDLGPYATQQGSNASFPAAAPVLVKDHSESDIQVDPTNPNHLIGSTKWFSSAEGYNHILGFYESLDALKTCPIQGHIPGYEGWTDNTDPVRAFDGFGNYYELILPYQFDHKADGNKQVNTRHEPNPH